MGASEQRQLLGELKRASCVDLLAAETLLRALLLVNIAGNGADAVRYSIHLDTDDDVDIDEDERTRHHCSMVGIEIGTGRAILSWSMFMDENDYMDGHMEPAQPGV